MKKIIWIVIAVAIVGIVWYVNSDKNQGASTGEPLKIGIAVGLTGYAANWGEGERKAIELAYEEYKDKLAEIQFITEDTKSTGVGTVNAVQKLVSVDHTAVVIGLTWSDSFQGGYPILNQAKIPSISSSAAFETFEPGTRTQYMFSTWWPQIEEIKALALDMKDRGYKRIILIHDEDAYNMSIMESFAKKAPEIVPNYFTFNTLSVPIGTTDFRTEIAKLKNEFKADAIFISVQDTSSAGPFMKQLQEQGVKVQVYETPDAENLDHLKKFPGYFDGIRYVFPSYQDDSSYANLHERFVKKYGSAASEGPAFVNAYNAAKLLFEVLAKGARTSEEITASLQKIVVSGVGVKNLSFDSNGQVSDARYIMKEVVNNSFQFAK